jgi:lipoprotein NlpD
MRLIFIFLLLFVTAAHGQVAKSLTTKTAPTGNKITYSDNAMDALDRGEVVPTRVLDTNKQLADTQPPGSSRFVWPTQGKVISTFDPTRKGIDIAGKDGQPVVAASDGKVLYAKNMRGYGNLIIIEHRDGMVTAYAHNKAILVREGQTVTQRQQIAEMGDSDADSVKLRFQIRHMGKPVDPATLLPPAESP